MAVTAKNLMKPRIGFMSRPFSSQAADALALILGLATSFTVRFVGDLPIAEVILIPVLPIMVVIHGRRGLRPILRPIAVLLGLWLFGQILTDIYRSMPAPKWMRGDAGIVFFAMDLLGLVILLSHNQRRKIIFFVGLAVGSILFTIFLPTVFALSYPWKFGYAYGTTTLVVLASCYFYSRRLYAIAALLIVGVAAVNLLENYRSPVLGLLVAIVLVFPVVPERLGRTRILPRAGTTMRVVVLAGMALGAGWLAGRLVTYVTSAGLIGEEAQAKNENQSKAGLLLGGRPEILVSARAVADSPILGHGSWAQEYKYVEMLYDMETEYEVDIDLEELERTSGGVIPSHSHLMGAWVSAGILGALFWGYILWISSKAVVRVATLLPALAPLYAVVVPGLIWMVMFSPFGQNARIQDALTLVVIFDLLEPQSVAAANIWGKASGRFATTRWVRRGALREPTWSR